jgi:hypothetical protein
MNKNQPTMMRLMKEHDWKKECAKLFDEIAVLRRENKSLSEQLTHCRKQLAKKDFDLETILPKYHLLLTANPDLSRHTMD